MLWNAMPGRWVRLGLSGNNSLCSGQVADHSCVQIGTFQKRGDDARLRWIALEEGRAMGRENARQIRDAAADHVEPIRPGDDGVAWLECERAALAHPFFDRSVRQIRKIRAHDVNSLGDRSEQVTAAEFDAVRDAARERVRFRDRERVARHVGRDHMDALLVRGDGNGDRT